MSSSQRDYIRANLDEFVSLHSDEMETMVDDALERFRAKQASANEQLSEEELAKAEKSVRTIIANRFAKVWCDVRGVA
jgi:TRAP-type C4-dicarboxylate transport system substrate-binding protein